MKKEVSFLMRDAIGGHGNIQKQDETSMGLGLKAALLLTFVCMLWGLNAVAIKVSNREIAPVLAAAIRSVIAGFFLMVWMRFKGMSLFSGNILDGVAVGALFGVEFAFLYTSLIYTTVSSSWILLYTAPFFTAAGAHLFLEGDRLSRAKGGGLLLAFIGVVILLSGPNGSTPQGYILGDLCALGAAVLWAATTIYIKRRLVGKVTYYHTLFYQTIFSIPLLFLASFFLGENLPSNVSVMSMLSLIYQSVIVAFLSYLLWFYLVHLYPVSGISAFSFLTPVFATIAGVVLLGEPLGLRLAVSLVLVSVGIYVVHRAV
ncbi:MAG: DMT family transporter [Desulfobacteraceae bacterium]|nr:MAG: DMT family transporter [Desulfobacteraceae bacterium]